MPLCPGAPLSYCGRILFHMGLSTLRVFAFAASFAFAAPAQVKPTLKAADYGKWETLGPAALSPDGKWLAHEIRRTDKNDELRVSPAGGGKTEGAGILLEPGIFRRFALAGLRNHGLRSGTGQAQEGQEAACKTR